MTAAVQAESASAVRARRNPSSGATPRASSERLPLSSLRATLDGASGATRWMVDPDGVHGRALMIPVSNRVAVPIRLAGDVTFTARIMLLPHDWRDGRGAVRTVLTAVDVHGRSRELWAASLRAADRGHPRGHRVVAPLTPDTAAIQLRVESAGPVRHQAVARALWVEPALVVAPAPPALRRMPSATATVDDTPATSPGDRHPVVSVLVPVHDPPPHMLEEAIASVTAQTYPHWELCLVDDGSQNPEIIAALQHHAAADRRIHLTRHEHAEGISAATNAALAMATGTYIALLDHDDTLTSDALQHVADTITAQPDLDMIYTDEDIVAEGRQIWVHLKPAWSPDTLRTNGYTCHLGVYRRSLVSKIGGFRSEFNGSQDVDMILRLTERTDRIAHIPRILYHWRAHASSTAGGDAKPYAYVAARNAIKAHAERTGLDADVGYGPPGLYRLAHRVSAGTSAELVLAVDGVDGLADAARSWPAQRHDNWRVLVAAPGDGIEAVCEELRRGGIAADRMTVIGCGGGPAAALSAAAEAATGEHLVLMQSPAMGLTHDWLARLLGYSSQSGIAAAGPVVLAPDGRIQQAGIALPDGIPLHLLHGSRSSMDNFFGYGTSVYNVSAVSGVLATPRATLHDLGGLDPAYAELSLIEYCLRATAHGHRTVLVPDARLRTTGPDPTTNDLPTIWKLRRTWTTTHTHDPYYNPNYRTDRGDFTPVRS